MDKRDSKRIMLANSFIQLLDSVPYDSISVSMVAQNCGVSRQTFYYYFHSLPELIVWTCHNAITSSVATVRNDPWLTNLQTFLEALYHNREIVIKLTQNAGREASDKLLKEEIGLFVMRFVEEAAADFNISPADRALIARFYTAGLVEILQVWIENDMRESPDVLAHRLELFVVNSSELLQNFDRGNH